ncbi:MAG: hypothetical protein AAF518_20845 [Spirochaetota bacterium]
MKIDRPKTKINNVHEFVKYLKEQSETSFFRYLLEEMVVEAKKASNSITWSVIYQIIRDADSGRMSWGLHKQLLSGVFYILSEVADSKSYRIVISYIKNLDRDIPLGAIKLIASRIPAYKQEVDLNELFSLAASTNDTKSAFGMISLSTLVVENRLDDEDFEKFQNLLNGYKNYKHYIEDYLESIKSYIEESRAGALTLDLGSFDGMV